MNPKIYSSFWSDPDVEALDPDNKLTFLWLITNGQTNLAGCCKVSERRFAFETGLPEEALTRAIQALPKPLCQVGDTIFIRNYIRLQFGSGSKLVANNVFKSICSQVQAVKNGDLKQAILTEYPELKEGLGKPFKGLVKGKEKEKEEVQEKEKAKAKTLEEVLAHTQSLSLPDSDGEWFWHKCEGNGWKNNGKSILDWQSTVRSWKAAKYFPSQKATNHRTEKASREYEENLSAPLL